MAGTLADASDEPVIQDLACNLRLGVVHVMVGRFRTMCGRDVSDERWWQRWGVNVTTRAEITCVKCRRRVVD